MRSSREVILVTGCPRSATSVVGDVLGAASSTMPIYEPMNYLSGDKIIDRYFVIPDTDGFSNEAFDDFVARLRKLNLNLKPGLWPEDSGYRRIAKRIVGGRSRVSLLKARFAMSAKTIIWKDPIAALTAEACIDRHDIPVIATYRSVYAVAASFKRMRWAFDVREITSRLNNSGGYAPEEILNLDLDNPSLNGSALWLLIYLSLGALSAQRSRIRFIDTDKLIDDPVACYRAACAWTGIEFENGIQRKITKVHDIKRTKFSEVPTGHAHTKKRNPNKANQYWRKVLDDQEIEAIEKLVEPFLGEIENSVERAAL